MELKRVIEFAKKQGYETAEYLNKWNGYDCYEPIMSTKEVTHTGLPLIILVKGESIRMSTPEEAFKQMDDTDNVAKSFDDIMKFNPYHDRLGRFTTSGGATSFTYRPRQE